MTFTYEGFTSGQADDTLWSKVVNKLNSLDENQAESVKVASSDMKGSDARAVIIYCNHKAPDPSTLGTTWSFKKFETGSDYDDMYAACVKYLNESPDLSDTQKFYSRLSMTNCSGHDSRLVLYYRNQN